MSDSSKTINKDTKAINPGIIVGVMLIGSFMSSLGQTLMTAALPSIMKDFSISADVGQWLTTVYLLVVGVMIPVTAYLINTITTRKLFIGAIALFGIGCFINLVSINFPMLLIGRALQAAGGGILMPLLQVVILYLYPVEKRGAAMGMLGIVVGFAPAIGPTLSGWLVDNFGWHSIFYVLVPIVIINIILALMFLKNVGEIIKSKLDILSVILSSLGFGGLLIGFTNLGHYGIGNYVCFVPLIVSIGSLILFTLRQFKLDSPLLELRVFKDKFFLISTILTIVAYASMMSATIIIPIYVQSIRGFSAMHSGVLLFPGAMAMVVLSPLTGRFLDSYGPRILCIAGMGLLGIGTFAYSFLGANTSLVYVSVMYFLRLSGISMMLMPLTVWGVKTLEEKYIPHATAINNTLRQVAGAIGTAIFVSLMTTATINSKSLGEQMASIHGIDVSFFAASILALVGFLMAIVFVKDSKKIRAN